MLLQPVHWHEGMFLRPHHFQAAQRLSFQLSSLASKWDLHFNWGLRTIQINLDALANFRLEVPTLKARLGDGTLVCIPEDGILPVLNLKDAFDREQTVTVYLAVPVLRLGHANVVTGNNSEGGRFLVQSLDIEDENTGLDPQPMQIRRLNLKLLLSTQEHVGYTVLPIARLEKSSRADAVPQLDPTYIPPILACDAWRGLQVDILQTLYHRFGKVLQVRATQIVNQGITFGAGGQGDALLFEQLRLLNEAYALLSVLAFVPGIHPLPAFMELCRLVGQLAIFDEATRRTPELPQYDHDDLGGCFYRLLLYINDLIGKGGGVSAYEERPFIGAGRRMQVTMEPKWLEPAWQMFVGVQSMLPADECVKLFTTPGKMDMKIGSSQRVDEIFQLGLQGLRFAHASSPPRVLPALATLIYFQVDRQAQQQEWQDVHRSLTLAIRLNENLLIGDIQGQREVRVRTEGGKTTAMQFTLYVVPKDKL
jgi:type VI secretion system protein ImpJ